MAWLTAAEIAEAQLPELPGSKRKVNALAVRCGWNADADRARKRRSRGGGTEYHTSLLPERAQLELQRRAATTVANDTRDEEQAEAKRAALWAAWAKLPNTAKAVAEERLAVIRDVETLMEIGHDMAEAVETAARIGDTSPRTLWRWLRAIDGVPRCDRLAHLVPRHRAAERVVERTDIDEPAWARFKVLYLTPERRTLRHCYDLVTELATAEGWQWPSYKTVQRRVAAELPRTTQTLAREGVEALKRLWPAQIRDRTTLTAMECVNADAHKIDVFVQMPDGRVIRPMIVAFQDVYSGRLLSWRVDESENTLAVLGAFGDMVAHFGVPEHVVMDNGRGFASKMVTGGIPNRFRFKVKADDPIGILPKLGCQVHWTIPYNGRAKPIERAFRDLADRVAKDPRFAGAYVGNAPHAKPENYGSKAVPWETFVRVLAEGIERHNTRQGREGQTAEGRSFVEVFDQSYRQVPIRRASAEIQRLCMMGATSIKARAPTGQLHLEGNVYWSPWCSEVAGRQLTVRFDPADLHAGLHVEDATGTYLGHAECLERTGFLDMDGAKAYQRANAARLRAERDRLKALTGMLAAEAVAAELDGTAPETPPTPDPSVVRPVRPVSGRRGGALAVRAAPDPDIIPREEYDALWLKGQERLRLIRGGDLE